MKKLILTLLLFAPLIGWGQIPSDPYGMRSPDVNNLHPFDKAELSIMKEAGFSAVSIKQDHFKTVYYLNTSGRVDSSKGYILSKRREKYYSTTRYKYNQEGLIEVRHRMGVEEEMYDSLTYDSIGRINSYYSFFKYGKNVKKRKKSTIYDIHRLNQTDDQIQLIRRFDDGDSVYLTLNNNNELIKMGYPKATDSISIERVNLNEKVKKFWFWEYEDSTYKLKREDFYENNRMTKTLNYKYNGIETITHHLLYDPKGRLLQINPERMYAKRILYTYNKWGLIEDIITVKRDELTHVKYSYLYL